MKVIEFQPKGGTIDDMIDTLKRRATTAPDVDKYTKELDPAGHLINDRVYRKDKVVKGSDGKERTEQVARIAISLQKEIVKKSVAFLFGNSPKIIGNAQTDEEKKVLIAIDKIMADNKAYSLNRKVARSVFSYQEAAEYWFPIAMDKEFTNYGYSTKIKIKHMIFSPERGDKLYPVFDATGDLVAFSREYEQVSGSEKIYYFETYTSEEKTIYWKGTGNGAPSNWELKDTKQFAIKKMPIVYAYKPAVEWEDVQTIIERLEKLLSNFADTNDYHASPKIFVKGKLIGFSQKGEAGAILEGDANTEVKYLSWQHAPESVKLEIETLLGLIYDMTNTPRISFENMKGMGAISGVALKLLFMDAHLKVKDHEEVFGEYLQRRLNVIKEYIAAAVPELREAASSLDVYAEILPYVMGDQQSELELIMSANGGKPVISQKTAVELAGLVDDSEKEWQAIQEEAKAERQSTNDLFNPAFQ